MNTPKKDTEENKETMLVMARAYTNSIALGAFNIKHIVGNNTADVSTMFDRIKEQVQKVSENDLGGTEQMLIAQAMTLDVLFHDLLRRLQCAEGLETARILLDMALRAQNQARKTQLALAAIKHPPHKQIVGQQNIALNQQINNEAAEDRAPQKEPSQIKPQNELLEQADDTRLDARAPQTTINAYPPMDAMETSRGKDLRGQSQKPDERS